MRRRLIGSSSSSCFGLSMAKLLLLFCILFTGMGLLLLSLSISSIDPPAAALTSPPQTRTRTRTRTRTPTQLDLDQSLNKRIEAEERQQHQRNRKTSSSCATVEEMGEEDASSSSSGGVYWEESLRVRRLITDHFAFHGASRVRNLPPEQFCKQGFVMGKASEAGFGNEMYKILTAAGLSIMLNRSLIIGQTRHIGASIHLRSIYPTPIFPLL